MTIIQSPATYNFAGNIPDLIVDTTEQLSFTLLRGGTQIVAETYTPAQNDRIVINLRNLLELLVEVPGYEEVATPIAQYTYTLGSTTGTFYCLPGGHGAAVSAESFLRGNFLTWQPQTRVTLYHTPHRLRYAALAACVCKVKGYFTDGTSAVISLLTMSAGNIYTMDVSFGTIRGKFDTQPTYYDVWVENTTGQAMTWGQRYMLADFEAGTNDYFIFANSLGGFDTIRFSGDRKEINKLESVNAIFDDQTLEYDIDRTRSWKKYTGYIADEQLRMWVLDFFNSPQRYHLTDSGALQRIYVSEPKLEDTAGETAGYEFTYAYSRQSRYINLERAETPQLLEITDPASEVFFLAPRLNQFEAADPASSADYLIPIQAAAADKWLAISLASLLDYIKPTGIDVDALQDYLTDHKYATQAWVSQQNFLTTAALDNYLLKSVWDEVFEITTENGVRVLNVKLDIVGLKGISAYGLGSTSGGSASGSLGELVNVGQWADAVPTADRVMVQLAGATHWSAKPLADLVGLDTAALAQYLTANSYLKASDISSYLTWANLSGKPTVYPTSWELVTGRPTKLSDLTDDVVAGNYLPKSTWDAVFEVVTVDGTPALKVKYDILGLKGVSAYGLGSTSGGGASGSLGELVNVGQWADEVPTADRVMVQLAGATHWSAKPLADLVGLDTAALAQYLTANSYLKASDISSYLTWANLSGKPTVYPTSWANIADKPTVYPTTWTSVTGRPTKLSQFTDDVVSGNYLPKPTWDAVFEVVTVDGTPALKVKYDILGLKGITAYADGTLSGGFSGALVDLVDVAVTNLASGDILKYNGTHFVNVPVSSIAGASSWDQITGKPDYFPTRWADVFGAPASLPASDVYPWAKAASKPTYTAAEVGALALSGGTLTGNVITIGSFILANSGAYPQLTFRATADNSERLLFRHGNDLKWRYNGTNDGIIYHSGNFNPSSKLDKSVWDEAFELKTVNGVRVISAKLNFLSVAGISAYATGPSSGGGGGGLDYDLLKQALTGAITPDGYPFTISASFLGAIGNTYLPLSGGTLTNTGNSAPLIITGSSLQACTKYMMNGSTVSGYFGVVAQGLNGAFMQYANGTISPSLIINNDAAPRFINTAGTQFALYHSGNFNPDRKFGLSDIISDLNNAPLNAVFSTDGTPANAPLENAYFQGFTFAMDNNPGFKRQWAFKDKKIWFRNLHAGSWSAWTDVIPLDNYLPLSGGSITGGLGVSGYLTAGSLKINETGSVYPQILFTGNNGNSSLLFVNAISRELVFRPADGVANDGIVYHSKNLTKLSQLTNDVVPSWAMATTNHYLPYDDTRNTNYAPYNSNIPKGLTTVHLKTPGIDGLTDGSTFHSSIYITPWIDASGGPAHNIAFTDSGNMWMRHGTTSWSEWVKVYHSGNFNPNDYLPLSGNKVLTGTLKLQDGIAIRDVNNNNVVGLLNIVGDGNIDVALGNSVRKTRIVTPNDTPVYRNDGKGAYRIYDSSNSNLSTVDWAAKNITAAGTVTAPTFVGALSGTATRCYGLAINNSAGESNCLQFMQTPSQNDAGDLPNSNWYHILKFNHGNGDTYYNRTLALPFYSDDIYTRRRVSGTAYSWVALFGEHNANRSDTNWTANTLTATKLVLGGITIDVYNGALRVNGNLVATGGVTSLATA